MENPFRRTRAEQSEPILTPVEKVTVILRSAGERANIVDLGASSAGINLCLTDTAREQLLIELEPAVLELGFK